MLTLIQGSGGSVSCALRTIQGGGVRVCVCLWTHIDESLATHLHPYWTSPGSTVGTHISCRSVSAGSLAPVLPQHEM